MKVKELIELLQKENQDREVIMSKDAEGNNFSPFCKLETGTYVAETTWYGYVSIEELTPELRKKGFTEEDVHEGVPALVLWPIN